MKQVEFDGTIHQFPDDFTDQEIAQALQPTQPSLGHRASGMLGAAHRSVGGALDYIDRGLLPDAASLLRKAQGFGGTLGQRMPATPGSTGFISPQDVNTTPRNLPEAGMQIAMQAAGPASRGAGPVLSALTRLGLGGLFGGAGMAAEGRNPISMQGAKEVAAPLIAGETIGAVVPPLVKALPGVKGAINEAQSKEMLGNLGTIDPEVAKVIEAQQVQPTLKGGATFAKIRQGVTSGAVQDVASKGVEQQMGAINMLSGSPRLQTPALQQAYEAMPPLARQQLVGTVDPQGFTLPQAQQIRGWLGSKAFSVSPQGQGVGPVPQQKLSQQVTSEIERVLSPIAMPLWKQMNLRYGGTMALAEPLGEQGIVQGLPNRLLMNRNYLSQYLDQNREDLTRRLGPKAYDALVQGVLGGAQPGTRDIVTSGAGTPADAFMQTFGRGTNSGAAGYVGVPLRTVAPNLGTQYTGRFPLALPPDIQKALDLVIAQKNPDIQQSIHRLLGGAQP